MLSSEKEASHQITVKQESEKPFQQHEDKKKTAKGKRLRSKKYFVLQQPARATAAAIHLFIETSMS